MIIWKFTDFVLDPNFLLCGANPLKFVISYSWMVCSLMRNRIGIEIKVALLLLIIYEIILKKKVTIHTSFPFSAILSHLLFLRKFDNLKIWI